MASPKWTGNAQSVADLWTATVGGTIEVGDVFKVTVNGKTLTYTATATTIASVVAGLVAAFNALDPTLYPEHAEYTAADASPTITFTADRAGVPGTITVATTEAGGGAADAQTFTIAHTATGTGPNNWDNPANWDTGAIPVSTDTPKIENSAVDILYGIDQNAVTLTSLDILKSFTGKIGLPRRNANGYQEYRETYLKISATTLNVGQGAGRGSGRIKVNVGANACAANVYGTGQPAEAGVESFLFVGTSASNTLNVTEGSVGVAAFAGEAANLSGILKVGFEQNRASDANVRCGSGVTLATVVQTGGMLEINSAMTTVTRTGGTMTHRGTGTITTLENFGGTFYDECSGTYTTVLNMATFDRQRVLSQQTIDTLRVYARSNTYIPSGTTAPLYGVTLTNPFECVGCELTDLGAFEVGPNKKYTFADI
jgi:hypothetical protein